MCECDVNYLKDLVVIRSRSQFDKYCTIPKTPDYSFFSHVQKCGCYLHD